MGHPRRALVAATALAAIVAAGAVQAQRFFREGSFAPRWAPAQMPDASFVVCRLAYRSVRMEQSGIGWQTDYPYAEINLTTRLSELTKTRVSRDANDQPNFYVVRLTDDALFNCPITVASDAGTIGIRDNEAERDFLKRLPTSFALKPEEVDRLRKAARLSLTTSKEFQQFLRDLH